MERQGEEAAVRRGIMHMLHRGVSVAMSTRWCEEVQRMGERTWEKRSGGQKADGRYGIRSSGCGGWAEE